MFLTSNFRSSSVKLLLHCCSVVWLFSGVVRAETALPFDPGLAPFELFINGQQVSHNKTFRALLPAEALTLKVAKGQEYSLVEADITKSIQDGVIQWQAANVPGSTTLRVIRVKDNAEVQIAVFILHAASKIKNGYLGSYRIGNYPSPLRGLEAYLAPKGYIEVTQNNLNTYVSPHFKLGQFLCKQQSAFPKYLVLRPKLLEKLEYLLEEVNAVGVRTDAFEIMSGYRTPYYNKAIGNVDNSRHIYGGAADIYVDVNPKDGVMDDLNKDGKLDVKDATYLYKIADVLVKNKGKAELAGGVGNYKPTAAHGAFVHVDVRGTRARWGH